MFKLALIALGVGTSSIAFANPDSTLECSSPKWVGSHEVSKNIFEATITKRCVIGLLSPANLEKFFQARIKRVSEDYKVISETEAPSDGDTKEFNVSLTSKDGGGTSVMTGTLHLNSDQRSQYTASFNPNKIDGTGNAEYLIGFSETTEVVRQESLPTHFNFQITEHIKLRKPAAIPTFIFQPSAESGIQKNFNHEATAAAQKVQDDLLNSCN